MRERSSLTRHTGWALALLTATYAVNFLDRQVVNILGESIKRDLGISDTQLGLLTGTAFGLFYSTLGLPIARLADHFNRVRVITVAVALWSALTAACGSAATYAQLFLCRLGVGVGEAGGTPPAQSLIADFFPQRTRTMAMAVFTLGVPIGSFLGYLLGGVIDEAWGWRMAFVIAGIPGIVLAALIHFTLREPPRGMSDPGTHVEVALPPLRESLSGLFRRKSFLRLVLGGTCGIFVVYVTNAWLPPFFIRVHHLSTGQVGAWIALCVVSYVWLGPTAALIQRVSPIRSRTLAGALQLSIANVIALLLGPPLIGYLSDRWSPTLGTESIRYALATAAIVSVLGAAMYLWAGRHVLADSRAKA